MAFGIALIVSFALGFLDGVFNEKRSFSNTLGSFVASTLLTTFCLAVFFWSGTPPFTAGSLLLIFFAALVPATVCYIVGDLVGGALGGASVAGVIVIIIALVVGIGIKTWAIGQGNATHLATRIQTAQAELGAFPETDVNHMLTVSEATAEVKANAALANKNDIDTYYNIDPDGTLQTVAGHFYYIYELTLTGRKDQKRFNYTVPGYVYVDAENTDGLAEVKTGFKMQYVRHMPYDYSIDRLLWKNFRNYYIGDVTLEVNDDWTPYYTATLDQPVKRWWKPLPKKFITLDPQTGNIQAYSLNSVPQWVDRVYSAEVTKQLLTWNGEWGAGKDKAPYVLTGNKGRASRYVVSTDPVLVYDKRGAASWLVLMSSKKKSEEFENLDEEDPSRSRGKPVSKIVMVDARTGLATFYGVPSGMMVPDAATGNITSANANPRQHKPAHMTLNLIYGRLTWVAPLIPKTGTQTSAGLALVDATKVSVSNVIVGNNKEEALAGYRDWVSSHPSNAAPGEQSKSKSVSGTIVRRALATDGNIMFIIKPDGSKKEDNNYFYAGKPTPSQPELTLAQVGDRVVITFQDAGPDFPRRQIDSLDVTDLALIK